MTIRDLYIDAIIMVLDDAERQLIKINQVDGVKKQISEEKEELLEFLREYRSSKIRQCDYKSIWKFAINLDE